MNKPSQLRITTPTPSFRCSAKTTSSTFTLKTEASGGDQTCLHCFVEPNAELPKIANVAAYTKVAAFAKATFTETAFAETTFVEIKIIIKIINYNTFTTQNKNKNAIFFLQHILSFRLLHIFIGRVKSHFSGRNKLEPVRSQIVAQTQKE